MTLIMTEFRAKARDGRWQPRTLPGDRLKEVVALRSHNFEPSQ